MNNQILIGIAFIVIAIFIYPSSAWVNILVNSDSQKDGNITSLTDFSETSYLNMSSMNTFTYDNYQMTLYANTTKLTNQTVLDNMVGITNNRYSLIWLALGIFLVILSYMWVRTL